MSQDRILIVEDDGIVAHSLRANLENAGYTVTGQAVSGDEALQKALAAPPDLVLMDIHLKGDVDGIQAARFILERLDVPVVYLTAYSDADTISRAKVTVPFGYVLKPLNERELLSTIEMALYRHKMEQELREREEWLATTLRSIADGVVATDGHGRVVLLNRMAEKLLGWRREEALGRPLEEVFEANDETGHQPFINMVHRIATGELPGMTSEHLILRTREGAERRIAESTSQICNRRSEVIGVVIAFRDITERRQQEEEIIRTQKLESLGLLAGGIAHDFNNILTAILGNISLARMMVGPSSDGVTDLLDEAERASLRAKDLTQQLLTFSKGGAPIKQTASLADIVRDSASFILRGSTSRCGFNIPDDLWPAEVDAGQISQVIQNVVLNAEQSMPGGGRVTITCANVGVTDGQYPALKPGRYVKISIADTGVGIPARHLDKIFDPYFTTKQKGSGLGLTTSFSIIKHHEGHVMVNSKVGEGSTFHIFLPAFEGGLPGMSAIDKGVSLSAGGHGRILVMDDEVPILRMVTNMLSSLGYEVTVAEEGAGAVELYTAARAEGRPFAAVILDLTVPGGMGGTDTIQKLRELDPAVKAIVCSGFSTDPAMAHYQDYGFSGVVTKPYHPKELLRTLQMVLG